MTGGFATFLALVGAAAAAAAAPPTIEGLPTDEIELLLLYGAAVLWLTGWAVERTRLGWSAVPGAVAMWAVFVATATSLYVGRDAVASRMREIAEDTGIGREPGLVVSGGEVTLTRRSDGSYLIPAKVDGRPATFVFDTGASSVVLTHETAHAIGIATDRLSFRVPVLTANGRALAAPVTLAEVAVGPIRISRVSALVSAPGALHQNLLGTTFLDRLHSYEVRGGRLVLRARTG